MCAPSPVKSGPDPVDTPADVDLLLLDAEWVVACDDTMTRIPSGGVAVKAGRIVAVGPSADLRRAFRGREEVDLSGHILLPGLVNTHTHAAMSVLRGIGDDLPLMRWLHEVVFPAEAACVSPDMVYRGTLLSCVEMLRSGTTTFCDGYFFEEQAARAVIEIGMRAVLGQGIIDFPSPDQPDPSRARERAEEFLDQFPTGCDRVRPSIFCHAPYTCGPQTLQWARALSRERSVLFQIHLSETRSEVDDIVNRYGARPAVYLDRLGVLGPEMLCAHAVWLDDAETALLAQRGVALSHNPESNMKLASGTAPVPEYLASGITVGLGTDGCASNNDLDLFSEMGTAARLHKVVRMDPTVCPAGNVLRMATLGGAKALGMENEIGSIEPEKQADLIALDIRRPHLTPVYDPVSLAVYCARGSDVRHVWVDGCRLVRDGEVMSVDVASVMNEVKRIASRFNLRNSVVPSGHAE